MITGDTFTCIGDTLVLSASGSAANFFTWYNPDSTSFLASGPTFSLNNVTSDTSIIMASFDGLCTSFFQHEINVHPINSAPSILGEIEYCEGDTLFITTDLTYNTHIWTYPDGSNLINTLLEIVNIKQSDSGVYAVQGIDNNSCRSSSEALVVVVVVVLQHMDFLMRMRGVKIESR